MRFPAIILFLVVAFIPPVAFADDADPLQEHLASLEEHPFLTEASLKSGLKILVNENRAYPVVAVEAVVPNCTAVFPGTKTGPESLLAAMFFRRGKAAAEGTVEENAHLIGARLSTAMDNGNCYFESQAPAPQWKRALRLHSRAVLDSAYDAARMRTEADRLESEVDYGSASPWVSYMAGLFDLAFHPNPGVPQPPSFDLREVSAETLSKLHKEMFSPEGMILVVSGDIDAIGVLREAAVLYGESAPGVSKRRVELRAETQNAFRYRKSSGALDYARILFGFHVPGTDSPDFTAIEILNAVVGLGRGSVLQARIRNQKKLILGGRTGLVPGPNSAYWTIDAVVPFENMDRGEIAILVELEILKRKALGDADLERARAQLERSYRDEIQTVSGRARSLARFEIRGDWQGLDRHISEIRNVQPSDLRRVAEKYFRLENCSLLEYLPASADAGSRTLQSVRSTLDALLNPATNEELASREREVTFPADIPDGDDDYRYSSIQYPFLPASILRGPEMYIREDHTTPLIHMGIFYAGGRLDEREQEAGITSLMVPLMLEGTVDKDTLQVYRQLEIYGGRLEPVVTDDYFGFYFSIPSKNFGRGFGILTDILKSPAFDAERVERHKRLLAEKRSYRDEGLESIFPAMGMGLYPGFSYGLDPFGSRETLNGLTPEALKAWYDRHIQNKKPLVVIIGDSQGTSLASYFVEHFSGSRFQEVEFTEEFAPPLEERESLDKSWDRSRSLVALGFQAPPIGDRDLYGATALRECLVLGIERLREENSWISSGVVYQPQLRGGELVAYALVDPGTEEKALGAMESRMYESLDRPMEFVEYRSSLNMALGDFLLDQQEPLTQMMSVAAAAWAGEGIEGYTGFIDEMGSVREDDLKEAAQRILNRDKAVSLRIRSIKDVDEKASDKAGLP